MKIIRIQKPSDQEILDFMNSPIFGHATLINADYINWAKLQLQDTDFVSVGDKGTLKDILILVEALKKEILEINNR